MQASKYVLKKELDQEAIARKREESRRRRSSATSRPNRENATHDQILQTQKLLGEGELTQKRIAQIVGLSEPTVYRIKTGKLTI